MSEVTRFVSSFEAEEWYPFQATVPESVAAQAHATPEATALADTRETLSYQELDSRANQLAHYLQAIGVASDVLVGICLERSVAFVVSALAVLKAGGAYLPLDPGYPLNRIAHLLEDARAFLLIAERGLAHRLPRGKWRLLAPETEAPAISAQPKQEPKVELRPEHLAYVIYTSGSTGQPKGAEIAHGSLMNLVEWHREAFHVSAPDRATQLAGLGFDAAVWELWPYLTAGASVHVPDEAVRNDPERLRQWLLERRITISFVPTPIAERLLDLEWPQDAPLRTLLTGGDRLHQYPRPGLPFTLVNNYGPTEATVVAASATVEPAERPTVLPPIGRPIANTRIFVLDEQMRPAPVGAAGELCIGGAGLARGYRNHPDWTAEKFVADPFSRNPRTRLYKTGDLGRLLPDGQIAFLGRIDNQVKIRGYRIEPDEIAAVLNRHPAVQASAVLGRQDEPGELKLVAYVVPEPDRKLSRRDLQAFLREELPDYMVPNIFVRLELLPLTAHGKLDRAALPAPSPDLILREAVPSPPANSVEGKLAAILGNLLGVEDVGVEDNFFLLGGHSFLGAQLLAKVRESFEVDLPLRSLFDNPTVAAVSAEIERLILAKLGEERRAVA